MLRFLNFYFVLQAFIITPSVCQSINAGSPVFEEALRRIQLKGHLDENFSFQIRPINLNLIKEGSAHYDLEMFLPSEEIKVGIQSNRDRLLWLPIRNALVFNSGRPYGWGNSLIIPNVGLQNYFTAGISYSNRWMSIQLQPEFLWAQNKKYEGYPASFGEEVDRKRFFYWNVGDYPERFGESYHYRAAFGQSKVSVYKGAFELGLASQNIWWGPGQFNALIFSNNAQGFPHLSLNTHRPAKTPIGTIEMQLIVGQLKDSQYMPSQHKELNERFFRPFTGDWRYINGMTISYHPKWVNGLFLGISRTFQNYNQNRGRSFADWFPIFNGITKESAGLDLIGESDRGRDQQISIFTRYRIPKTNSELYFEYGRRDHALNWREFLLNPEHARAYILGFTKLFELSQQSTTIQVRAEMTQQQESINRMVRYLDGSGLSWHTHSRARGFAHKGEALGVGIGSGSNVQSLEISYISGLNKLGILFERLANHQDFYYNAFGDQRERLPWVDLSVGILMDYQWERFMVTSKSQFVYAANYQWQLNSVSTPDAPVGMNKFSNFTQMQFMYFF